MNTRMNHRNHTETCTWPEPKCLHFRARTIRTFLAEDSPLFMALLGRIVSKEKRVLIVGSAADGHQAVSDARSLRPDLVISDLQMPKLDGAGVTRFLKQGPNPPVVFVATSDDTTTAQLRCMSAGADAFLVKGSNLALQLLAAIQAFFPDTHDSNDIETQDFNESVEDAPDWKRSRLAG